jgi:hypothetical protein
MEEDSWFTGLVSSVRTLLRKQFRNKFGIFLNSADELRDKAPSISVNMS